MLRKAVGLDKQVPRGLWYVFSTSTSSSSSGSRYFSGGGKKNEEGKAVENDDDLDGYWKGMESRVSNSAFRKRKEGSIGRGEFLDRRGRMGAGRTNALRHAPGTKTLKHQSHAIIHARKIMAEVGCIYIYIYILSNTLNRIHFIPQIT